MRLHPCLAALAVLASASSAATAQALKRPKDVGHAVHVVVTQPLEVTDARIAALKLPPGFRIAKWAEGLKHPRVIAVAPGGNVYVSSRDDGLIYLLKDGAERSASQQIVREKKNVHGLAIREGRLFYAATTETFSAPILADGTLGAETRIAAGLPDVGQHNDRTLAFGPDGWLYESVGSTCNDCDEQNPESATLVRMRADGSGREVFARGLRNTIGFQFRPGSQDLWGWDDGADWRGDDAQREELNLIRQGAKYGWPFVLGDQLSEYRDPPEGQGTIEQWDHDSVRPVLTHTAHSSGMQLAFYEGAQFPAEYRGDAYVTLHGSWNREPPSGFEVVRVHFDGGRAVRITPCLSGFLSQTGPKSWARFARPMGLAVLPDGSLLMGEDQNGVIYRISYAR